MAKSKSETVEAEALVTGAQLDLFSGRTSRWQELMQHLEAGEWSPAAPLLQQLLRSGLGADLIQLAHHKEGLFARISRAGRARLTRFALGRELVQAEHPLERAAGRGLLRQLARECAEPAAAAAEVDGVPLAALPLYCSDRASGTVAKGDLELAHRLLLEALVAKPDWAEAFAALAELMVRFGAPEAALTELRQALESSPLLPLEARIDTEELRQVVELAEELAPGEPVAAWRLAAGLIAGQLPYPEGETVESARRRINRWSKRCQAAARFSLGLLQLHEARRQNTAADDAALIEQRRALKDLAPELFALLVARGR